MVRIVVWGLAAVVMVACGGGDEQGSGESAGVGCADVVGVELEPEGDGTWTVRVTVSSADTGEEKYADRWEVRDGEGAVLGERILTHPHVDEQPFTRSLSGLEIPESVERVVVLAHDSVAGFCGREMTADVPR